MTELKRSPASKALDEAIELDLEGRSLYPERSYFLDADAPGLGKYIKRAFDNGYSVVLVFADGSKQIMHADSAAA
jgi:hypothetical protein